MAGADGGKEGFKEEGGGGPPDMQGVLQGIASDAAIEANMEEAARVLLGQGEAEDGDGPAHTTTSTSCVRTASNPEQWVNGFARHNVVKNVCFAAAWKEYSDGGSSFEDSIGDHSMRGNSRDEPTPYTWYCQRTEGCTYTTIKQDLLGIHELSCNPARVGARKKEAEAEDVLTCDRPGCAYKTSRGKDALRKHIGNAHGWTPKPCAEPGPECDPEKLFETRNAYEQHQARVHSGRWPAKCIFPGCPETKDYHATNSLTRHLKAKHGLSAEEVLPYLPPLPARTQWVRQTCVVPTCANPVLWVSRSAMLTHMKSPAHKMKDEDAQELVDREARYESVMPEKKVPVPGGNGKKRGSRRASAATPAGGKENKENHAPPPPPLPSALDGVQRPGGHDDTGDAPAKPRKLRMKK